MQALFNCASGADLLHSGIPNAYNSYRKPKRLTRKRVIAVQRESPVFDPGYPKGLDLTLVILELTLCPNEAELLGHVFNIIGIGQRRVRIAKPLLRYEHHLHGIPNLMAFERLLNLLQKAAVCTMHVAHGQINLLENRTPFIGDDIGELNEFMPGNQYAHFTPYVRPFGLLWFLRILPRTMSTFPIPLATAAQHFKTWAAQLTGPDEAKPAAYAPDIKPAQLIAGIEQFLAIALKLDQDTLNQDIAAVAKDDVTQLGEYGLQLLTDLSQWEQVQAQPAIRQGLKDLTLAIAGWVIRHEGGLQTLALVVDTLAQTANRTRDQAQLAHLAAFMRSVAEHSAPFIQSDLERASPGRPWRVLHLNYGIAATRAHYPDLMRQAFDRLADILPEEAPRFFTEGMREMDKLNYPPHVRAVMQVYFDRYARPTLH